MTKETYTTRTGKTQFMPVMTEREYLRSRSEDNSGFCLACGTEADGVEPDARKYKCESCGEPKVYGLEELLLMDLMKIK